MQELSLTPVAASSKSVAVVVAAPAEGSIVAAVAVAGPAADSVAFVVAVVEPAVEVFVGAGEFELAVIFLFSFQC